MKQDDKQTFGPWSYDDSGFLLDKSGWQLAAWDGSDAEGRVAAAGPELLEAIEIVQAIAKGDSEAIKRFGYSFTNEPLTCSEWAKQKIDAAIAKARGQA